MAPKETKAPGVRGGLGHMDNVFKATAGAARGRYRADVHMGFPPFNLAGPENSWSQGGGRQVWGATHEGKDWGCSLGPAYVEQPKTPAAGLWGA